MTFDVTVRNATSVATDYAGVLLPGGQALKAQAASLPVPSGDREALM